MALALMTTLLLLPALGLSQDSGDLFSPVDSGVSARSLQQDLNPERIVGGSEVKAQGLYPFSVSLKIRTRSGRYLHFCGGAAITTSAILTAAHCVQTTPRSSLYVSIGEHDIKSVGENERLIKVAEISIHPRFSASNFNNDIAVLKLDHPFQENKFRQTIHLMKQPDYLEQNQEDINDNSQLTVLGWGTLSQGGLSAKKLHHVNVPYIPHRLCQTAMAPHKVFKGMLCAGDLKQGGIDACQGDSGGPLVYQGSKQQDGPMAQLTPTTEQTKITKSTPTTTYHSTTVNNTTPPPTQLPTSITNVPTLATLSPTPASHKNEDILLPTTSTATTDHSSEHVFVHPLLAPASQLGRSVPRPRWFVRTEELFSAATSLANYYLNNNSLEGQEAADEVKNIDYSNEDDDDTEKQDVERHQWVLGGLVSWGIGCAKPGYAGIYTNVAHYRDWVLQQV